MNNNQIININGISCYEKDGMAYLSLEAVARGLGFTETAASGNECIRWRTVKKHLTDLGIATCCDGGLPEFIPENIFYRLAMKAKNEAAEKFQAKIADEVIPSIRKHGMYATAGTIERMLGDPDAMIKVLTTLKEEREQRKALESKVETDRPKVLFADAVSASKTSILVGDLAKLLRQNGVDIGQGRLFQWLRDNGYLIKQNSTSWNMPTQRAIAFFKAAVSILELSMLFHVILYSPALSSSQSPICALIASFMASASACASSIRA